MREWGETLERAAWWLVMAAGLVWLVSWGLR